MEIKKFKPSTSIAKVKGVTHFRLFLCAIAFSDFVYDAETGCYTPANPLIHATTKLVYSDYINYKTECPGLTLTAQLPLKTRMPKSAGIFAVTGIEFYKEENNLMYCFPGNNRMRIGAVL